MCLFFFNDTATTEIYTLSLHDALPISPPRTTAPSRSPASRAGAPRSPSHSPAEVRGSRAGARGSSDRKSTRLNSSHANISYAVFCLKKKNKLNHHSYFQASIQLSLASH